MKYSFFLGLISASSALLSIATPELFLTKEERQERILKRGEEALRKKKWRRWLFRGGIGVSSLLLAYALWKYSKQPVKSASENIFPKSASENISPSREKGPTEEQLALFTKKRQLRIQKDVFNQLREEKKLKISNSEPSNNVASDPPSLGLHSPLSNDYGAERVEQSELLSSVCSSLAIDLMPTAELQRRFNMGYLLGLIPLPNGVEIDKAVHSCANCGDEFSMMYHTLCCDFYFCRSDWAQYVIAALNARDISYGCPNCKSTAENSRVILQVPTEQHVKVLFDSYDVKVAEVNSIFEEFRAFLFVSRHSDYFHFMQSMLADMAGYFDRSSLALIQPDFVLNSIFAWRQLGDSFPYVLREIFSEAGVDVVSSLQKILYQLSFDDRLSKDDQDFFNEKREAEAGQAMKISFERVSKLLVAEAKRGDVVEVKKITGLEYQHIKAFNGEAFDIGTVASLKKEVNSLFEFLGL